MPGRYLEGGLRWPTVEVRDLLMIPVVEDPFSLAETIEVVAGIAQVKYIL